MLGNHIQPSICAQSIGASVEPDPKCRKGNNLEGDGMAEADARTRALDAPRARRPGGLWLAAQLVSPFIFAAFIVLAVWGGYRPEFTQAEDVFRHVMVCVTVALAYLAVQAFAVVLQPVGSDVRPLLDVLMSLAPALVIAFAIERWLSGYLQLDFYQIGVLWVASLAVLLDLVCFTLFAIKANRLPPDVVVTS